MALDPDDPALAVAEERLKAKDEAVGHEPAAETTDREERVEKARASGSASSRRNSSRSRPEVEHTLSLDEEIEELRERRFALIDELAEIDVVLPELEARLAAEQAEKQRLADAIEARREQLRNFWSPQQPLTEGSIIPEGEAEPASTPEAKEPGPAETPAPAAPQPEETAPPLDVRDQLQPIAPPAGESELSMLEKWQLKRKQRVNVVPLGMRVGSWLKSWTTKPSRH